MNNNIHENTFLGMQRLLKMNTTSYTISFFEIKWLWLVFLSIRPTLFCLMLGQINNYQFYESRQIYGYSHNFPLFATFGKERAGKN